MVLQLFTYQMHFTIVITLINGCVFLLNAAVKLSECGKRRVWKSDSFTRKFFRNQPKIYTGILSLVNGTPLFFAVIVKSEHLFIIAEKIKWQARKELITNIHYGKISGRLFNVKFILYNRFLKP